MSLRQPETHSQTNLKQITSVNHRWHNSTTYNIQRTISAPSLLTEKSNTLPSVTIDDAFTINLNNHIISI